jgi:hypothetical protein
MKKLLVAAAFTAVVAIQAPAKAAVITVLDPGITSIAAPTETFDTRALGPAVGGPANDGGFYSGLGRVVIGGDNSTTAAPFFGPNPGDRDTTNYLSIGPNHDPETITYTGPKDLFGLYWGSVDTYNTLDFYLGKTLVNHFTGADIIPLLANGNQDSYSSNRYVVFTGLTFDRVVLGSSGTPNFVSQAAFEIDNIAAAAPEPATWLMMLIGFAGLAFVAYRRTKRHSAAIEAV